MYCSAAARSKAARTLGQETLLQMFVEFVRLNLTRCSCIFFQFKQLSWFEHFDYFNQLSWIVQFVSLTVFAESRLGMTLARNLPKTDGGNGVPLWLSQDCLFPRSYNWTMIALLKS